MSYTTFALSNARLDDDSIARGGRTTLRVDVTNTGTRAGTEVIQLYIRDLVSTVTRPVKELKAFAKVMLDAGASSTVALEIVPESLAFYDYEMQYVVEPGDFAIMVGTSSRDIDLTTLTLRVTS
jgi:beta-glucosidase